MESFIGMALLLLFALFLISYILKSARALLKLIFSPAGLILGIFSGLFILLAPTMM